MDLTEASFACQSASRRFSSHFASIPHDFSFRKNGKQVYFLHNNILGNSLFSTDIGDGLDHSPKLVLNPNSKKLSRSEELLRERMRATGSGITFYKYFDSFDGLLVDTGTACCFYSSTPPDSQDEPLCLNFPHKEEALDYKLCPTNPELLGCVSNGDIWLLSPHLKDPFQLTDTKGKRPLKVTAGSSSFILQEEFDRYTGYWWSPGQCSENGTYKILYEEVDESAVKMVHTFNPGTQQMDSYSYPKAGTTNASSMLKIASFRFDQKKVVDLKIMDLADRVGSYLKGWEYIVRVGWTDNGDKIWMLLMNRDQSKSQIILVDVKVFESEDDIPAPVILWEETSSSWINYSNVEYVEFLPPTSGASTRLLITSEKTGFPHIILLEGNLPSQKFISDSLVCCKADLKETMVTNGEWNVLSSEVWYDSQDNLVYFMGSKSSPLDKHLYVVKLDGELPNSDPVQLTKSNLYHSVHLNTSLKMFVTECSNQSTSPSVEVFSIDVLSFETSHLFTLHKGNDLPPSFTPPTNFTTTAATGETLYGVVYPPAGMKEGDKYPTVVYVYGGPGIQLVTNAFHPSIIKLSQWIENGFAVMVLDNRGSSNRGARFESHIKNKMGSVEVDDQVTGLEAAANTVPFIDLDRVAICGWSYGGYMSLLCLAKKKNFKVAIAGAPVTDWLWYDTGYTERYLGIPTDNTTEMVYKSCSVVPLANQFPNKPGRLLLIHGSSDENVFFTHTSLLIDSLINFGKPYQLQVYNNERHGLRSPTARSHCDATVLLFLLTNL